MIDFDALVLGPAMDTFARPVSIIPLKSRSSSVPYAARGVYAERPVDVLTEGDAILSSTNITLGIRLSEFTVEPVQGDKVVIGARTFLVDDTDPDGEGGLMLALKVVAA